MGGAKGVLIAERVKPSGSRWNVFKSGYHAFSGLMLVAPRTPSLRLGIVVVFFSQAMPPLRDPDQGVGARRPREARRLVSDLPTRSRIIESR